MSKPVTNEDLGKYFLVSTVVIVIAIAYAFSSMPVKGLVGGSTQTVTAISFQTEMSTTTATATRTTTLNITTTVLTPSITTATTTVTSAATTITQTTTQSVTSTSTISQVFPSTIAVSGSASTKATLGTATTIHFLSGSSSQSATITNGKYSVVLTNRENYAVTIDYSLPVSGGTCSAGNLPLNALQALNEDWTC